MPSCSRCGQQVEETALFCSNCGAPLRVQTRTGQSVPTLSGSPGRFGQGRYEGGRERLRKIVDKFRQKGATNPENAMTLQELDLPPLFEEAMHRRLGQSGIVIETNGKYYLDEARLKQIREQQAKTWSGNGGGNGWRRSGSPYWFRIVGILLMLPIGLIVALGLSYFSPFRIGFFPGEALVILLILSLMLTVARILFWRSRRRY
jgi:hypothetical protein